ncbi:MAG TPA: hypothetical protein VG942_09480 [Hyphomonadaceae bacterium]|nr:hypothetical protein [Hyphomonadaceae bacterium]
MNRLSARSWRIIAALGFWGLVGAAILVRGRTGLTLAYAAAIWLAVFSLLAWQRQDEFERAAQKFSWVFGGLFGLLVSLAFLPVLLQPGVLQPLLAWIASALAPPDGPPPDPAAEAFLLGAIYIAAGQLIGFLVCWVGWHIAKR